MADGATDSSGAFSTRVAAMGLKVGGVWSERRHPAIDRYRELYVAAATASGAPDGAADGPPSRVIAR
jgi:hypothetical protein